jgi:preprotein translocase subunit SecG
VGARRRDDSSARCGASSAARVDARDDRDARRARGRDGGEHRARLRASRTCAGASATRSAANRDRGGTGRIDVVVAASRRAARDRARATMATTRATMATTTTARGRGRARERDATRRRRAVGVSRATTTTTRRRWETRAVPTGEAMEIATSQLAGGLETARAVVGAATVALIMFQGPKGDGVVNSLNESRMFGSASKAKSAVDYVTYGLIFGFIAMSAVLAASG